MPLESSPATASPRFDAMAKMDEDFEMNASRHAVFRPKEKQTNNSAFLYQIKVLDEKFRKTIKRNRGRDLKKPLFEFKYTIWTLSDENKTVENLRAIADFFEFRVLPMVNKESEFLELWVEMMDIYYFIKKFKKAKKCRQIALEILQEVVTTCKLTICQEGCCVNPYEKLFPCTNQNIFIVDEDFEHSVCYLSIRAIEANFCHLEHRHDQIALIYESLLIWLGRMSMLKENYVQAISEFRKASKIMKIRTKSTSYRPKAFVLYQAALCFMKLGNMEFAKKSLKKCISLHNPKEDGKQIKENDEVVPDFVNCARMALGHIYYDQGDVVEASWMYQDALKSIGQVSHQLL